MNYIKTLNSNVVNHRIHVTTAHKMDESLKVFFKELYDICFLGKMLRLVHGDIQYFDIVVQHPQKQKSEWNPTKKESSSTFLKGITPPLYSSPKFLDSIASSIFTILKTL